MPRTRPFPLLLTALVAAVAWLATAGTAQAHTALSSSSPAEGSTVTEPLTAVTLTFSGAVRRPELTVTGPDGAVVSTAPATGEGSSVTVPVTPSATGPHTVTWAVTSADGHDLTGTVAFDYAGPVAVPAAPDTPAPTQASAATSTSTAAPSPVDVVEEAAAEAPEDGSNLLVTGTIAALLLAAVAGAVFLVRRRRG